MSQKRCTQCFYRQRTSLTAWIEVVPTCLHILSREPTGRPFSCTQAREQGRFCGPEGFAFIPVHAAAPASEHVFRQ